jgi:hypothetical protein
VAGPRGPDLRDILDALVAGELTPAAAEARLAGYVTGGAGLTARQLDGARDADGSDE